MVAIRDSKGRFIKGESISPETQFKIGQHWRKEQIFRKKEWLINEYIEQGRSASDIADQFKVTANAILFWLKKHKIKTRNTSEAREKKYWGQVGSDNPMWNRRGELNPRWLGGITPERQEFYTSREWKDACSAVWKRDNATCQRCSLHKNEQPDMPYHIHHIVSFKAKELRAKVSNLVLVCEVCHDFIHSKKNVNAEYISKI